MEMMAALWWRGSMALPKGNMDGITEGPASLGNSRGETESLAGRAGHPA
jgi:hypothetical protein